MKVAEWMTPHPVTVPAETSLAECRSIMLSGRLRHLPVVDTAGSLVGLAADYLVFPSVEATVAEVMERAKVRSWPDEDLSALITRSLWSSQEAAVILGDGDVPVGIITEHDWVRLAAQRLDEDTPVERFATATLFGLEQSQPARQAASMMAERFIRHIVVLEGDGSLHGVVSYRDAVDAREGETTGDLVRRTPFTTSPAESLRRAARLMSREKIGCLPVVDGGHPVGVLTRTDVTRALRATLALEPDDSGS